MWTSLPYRMYDAHLGDLWLRVAPHGGEWAWYVARNPGGRARCPVVSRGVCPEHMMARLAAMKEAERLLNRGDGR